MILPSVRLVRTFAETLDGRHPDDLTTITLPIGVLRELTKDIPATYTTTDVDRR